MVLAIVLFLVLVLPFQSMIPTLDGRHDMVNVFGKSLMFNNSAHPPFKSLILHHFVTLFGVNAYTWLGLILGIFGIVGIYLLTKVLVNRKAAVFASLLLATSGLYISTSLFSMTDFMISIFAIYSFYFYYTQRLSWYSVVTIMGVLTKETFILVPASILVISLFQKRFRWRYLFFILAFVEWMVILKMNHLTPWNQQNFSEFNKFGSFGTIFMNIITLKIFNQYAFGAWLQMIVLNFNWYLWLIAILFLPFIKWSKKALWHYSPIILFVFLYVALVISFPTWAIPRYMLPVLVFLYVFIAAHLWKNVFLLIFTSLIIFVSLFSSIDPLSRTLYPYRELLSERFYQVPHAGNDGITYNMQYLYYTKKVNMEYYKKDLRDCYSVFLGLKDDPQLRAIYHFSVNPCP